LKQWKDAKEVTMSPAGKTQHWAVDRWLGPTSATHLRKLRFYRARMHRRRVCVEAMDSGGLLSILFFRHDDGSWNVYPPAKARPAMCAWRTA
jgi:hypothetical protein